MHNNNDDRERPLDITEVPTGEYPVLDNVDAGAPTDTALPQPTLAAPAQHRDAENASFWLAHLEDEVTRLQAKWQSIDAEFKSREVRAWEQQRELEARDATIGQLRSALQRETESLRAANERLADKAGELDALVEERRVRDERIATLATELADAAVTHTTALAEIERAQADAARLTVALRDAEAAAAAGAARSAQLLDEQNALRSNLQDLENYINGRHSSWAVLNSELAGYKVAVSSLESTISARDAEKAAQENENRQLLIRIQSLERECAELAGRRKERESAYDDLQTKLAAYFAQIEQLKTDHASRTSELQQAAARAVDAERQIESVANEVKSRDRTIESLNADLAQAKNAVAEITTANRALTGRVSELDSALAERSREVQGSRDDLRASREQLTAAQQQLADRSKQLVSSQELADRTARQVERLEQELRALQAEAARAHAELHALEAHAAEIGHLRSDAVAESKKLENELAIERELVASLKRELGAKQVAADLLERSVGRITDLGASLAALDKEMRVGDGDGEPLRAKPSQDAADFVATIAGGDAAEARMPVAEELLPIDALLSDDRPRATAKRAASEAGRKLVITLGAEVIDYPIVKSPMTIGRGHDSDIRIASHFVSRLHATISTKGVATIIEDVGSKNGILVNSERVRRRVLRNGDVVSIGGELNLKFVDATH